MLVLSLRTDDSVVFSNGFAFMVSGVRRGTVRISIQAPKDVRVLRGSLPPPELVQDALKGIATQEAIDEAFNNADAERAKRHANSVQRSLG